MYLNDTEVEFDRSTRLFVPETIFVRDELNSGGVVLTRYGLIVTREQLQELFDKAVRFIDHVGDSRIAQHNYAVENPPRQERQLPVAQRKSVKAGWVYVVKISGDSLYKIGMTAKKPTERLAQFVPRMPYEAELVYTKQSKNPANLEARLHELYADFRQNGEWFNLSDGVFADLIEYLENVKE